MDGPGGLKQGDRGAGRLAPDGTDNAMIGKILDFACHPRSIAVVGASNNPLSFGFNFFHHLVSYGFEGALYPVSPNWEEVCGIKAYPSLLSVPTTVDYIICCLSASKVPDLLRQCPAKEVKVVHLYTGRLSETGQKDAADLEGEILRLARELGIRLLGPNCMGVYNPAGRISFGYDFPTESGNVGLLMQSGGAACEFVYYAGQRGMRFSKVISYGNALDIDESDILEYLADDDETEVIAAYIEGLRDGRRFLDTLRKATPRKPVIVLKAGKGGAGSAAASSHTAALAGSEELWTFALRQVGAAEVYTLEDMVDMVMSFSLLPPITGHRVGISGGGGGKSVLSAGEWEAAGFDVAPLPPEIVDWVKGTLPELWWGWLRNPIDISIMPFGPEMFSFGGDIANKMANSEGYDLAAVNVSLGGPLSGPQLAEFLPAQIAKFQEVGSNARNPMVIVLNPGAPGPSDLEQDRWRTLVEIRPHLIEAGFPVYTSPSLAARAVIRLIRYYQWRQLRPEMSAG